MIIFVPLLTAFKVSNFLRAARLLPEISLSLRPNYNGQVKLVQIPDTHGKNKEEEEVEGKRTASS